MPLDPSDQSVLFQLARGAIEARLDERPPPALPQGRPALERERGAFVTLRKGEELRGCVGHAVARMALARAVRTLAVSAAFQDRRFRPLTREEYPELELEISVLTELTPADPQAIEIGHHGLMISRGSLSGLLLPQVASERDWTPEEFLAYTCRKAGLPPDAWTLEGTRLEWFSCEIYEEPGATR